MNRWNGFYELLLACSAKAKVLVASGKAAVAGGSPGLNGGMKTGSMLGQGAHGFVYLCLRVWMMRSRLSSLWRVIGYLPVNIFKML